MDFLSVLNKNIRSYFHFDKITTYYTEGGVAKVKYEFITLTEQYKNGAGNIYCNDRNLCCISLTKMLQTKPKLNFPVAVFINGVLMESSEYEYENGVITFLNTEDTLRVTDKIYILMTSTDVKLAGYIKQYKKSVSAGSFRSDTGNFTVYDDTSLIITKNRLQYYKKKIIAVAINGILYGAETFTVENNIDLGVTELDKNNHEIHVNVDRITFSLYRPDEKDDISILVLDRASK